MAAPSRSRARRRSAAGRWRCRMLAVSTVGAGGGSIAWRDPGGALRVGPQSAGADPGPACYGLGGELATVTDANLLLGRLRGVAGGISLDRGAAERAVASLASELGIDLLACAEGIVRVANAEMVRALRVVTVQRGIDPRRYALLAFGGAGPLHACCDRRRARDHEDRRAARVGGAGGAGAGGLATSARRAAHGAAGRRGADARRDRARGHRAGRPGPFRARSEPTPS